MSDITILNTRSPYLCECGQGDPPEHVCCSACGDDWHECQCSAADHPDVPWLLAGELARALAAQTARA